MRKIPSLFFIIFMCIFIAVNTATGAEQKKWATPKHINTYIQPGLERTEMMKHAFAEWSRLAKNHIVFYYVNSPEKADIDVIFSEKLTKSNNADASGYTECTYYPNGEMIHATIYIPAQTHSGIKLSRDDVYTSMLHEIGHAMGIVKHSTNPNNIMYPIIDAKREISKYDLAELYRIYGWK